MSNFFYPVTQPFKQYTDADGKPLQNGYIYFGTANQNPETTPISMYWDAAGTIVAAQPLRTVNGYIVRGGTPANIFAAGDFSITVRDSGLNLVFTSPVSADLQLALSVAGSSSAAAIPIADAGNYYPTDNVEAALQSIASPGFLGLTNLSAALQALLVPTGARMGYVGVTAPTGWVLADGKTIGDASSGATERANADTVTLYTLLWNSYANAQLAIQDSAGSATTRGASASNDYAAHKRLPLPDYRGRIPATLDNLGGTTASRLTAAGSGIDGTVMGNSGGAETHTLTTAELPVHNHALTDPTHTHTFTGNAHTHSVPNAVSGTTNLGSPGGSGLIFDTGSPTTQTSGSTTATGTNAAVATGITLANTGSGTAHTVTQPTIVENTIIKL